MDQKTWAPLSPKGGFSGSWGLCGVIWHLVGPHLSPNKQASITPFYN